MKRLRQAHAMDPSGSPTALLSPGLAEVQGGDAAPLPRSVRSAAPGPRVWVQDENGTWQVSDEFVVTPRESDEYVVTPSPPPTSE
jgi:hypothetical protein